MSQATSVSDTMLAYNTAAAELIGSYLSEREPGPHLYDPLRSFMTRPGKGIRPALCLAACEAFGGSFDEALRCAAAVELLHAAFLIHDDIEDGSLWRRGEPTLHEEHGVPIALNAGDALAVICLRPLLDNVSTLGPRLARAVLTEFQLTMETTVEGQAVELGWRLDGIDALTPLDYLDMILRKTCAYTTILPLRVGAMIGSRQRADLDAIAQFGFVLGAAFQIRDDVLDITSDATTGNDLMGDIREGKLSLILIHFLRHAEPAERATGRSLVRAADGVVLGRRRPGGPRGDRRGRQRRVRGGLRRIASRARARRWFEVAFAGCAPSPALSFLRDVIPFMAARAH